MGSFTLQLSISEPVSTVACYFHLDCSKIGFIDGIWMFSLPIFSQEESASLKQT
jgi:predicted ester cyclase